MSYVVHAFYTLLFDKICIIHIKSADYVKIAKEYFYTGISYSNELIILTLHTWNDVFFCLLLFFCV